MIGTVSMWKNTWGFITLEDGSRLFVHQTAVEMPDDGFRTLYEGEKVEFDIVPGRVEGKMAAANVREII